MSNKLEIIGVLESFYSVGDKEFRLHLSDDSASAFTPQYEIEVSSDLAFNLVGGNRGEGDLVFVKGHLELIRAKEQTLTLIVADAIAIIRR